MEPKLLHGGKLWSISFGTGIGLRGCVSKLHVVLMGLYQPRLSSEVIMISTILRYEVEVFDEDKSDWVIRKTINPNYDLSNESYQHRFLWWTWERPYVVIRNERKARIRARRKAFKWAWKYYPDYPTSVFVTFKFPEIDEPIRHRVWENGYYYSTH
jgi:hypothetical protein